MTDAGPVARAAELAALGHRGNVTVADRDRLERAAVDDPDPRVRTAALAALVRAVAGEARGAWTVALVDPAPAVRRRAAELTPDLSDPTIIAPLLTLLGDVDVTVVEATAWAIGESGDVAVAHGAVDVAAATATHHRDVLAREAAVAALGALGDPAGLPAILRAVLGQTRGPPSRWSLRWHRSTVPRSKPRSTPRSKTATGRCARRPRTCAAADVPVRSRSRSSRPAGARRTPLAVGGHPCPDHPPAVVVWSTGWIGTIAIRAIRRRPDFELVGVWVHTPEKVGQDAGVLAGTEAIGLATTDDFDALLALAPDCVVYAASGPEQDAGRGS